MTMRGTKMSGLPGEATKKCHLPPHGHLYVARSRVKNVASVHTYVPLPACSGSHARARPLVLRRVRRQELLSHTQRPEVPRAAVHHIRRVVRTGARVTRAKSCAYISFAFRIRTWCWCFYWGIWGSGRSAQSFCPNTELFFARLLDSSRGMVPNHPLSLNFVARSRRAPPQPFDARLPSDAAQG